MLFISSYQIKKKRACFEKSFTDFSNRPLFTAYFK